MQNYSEVSGKVKCVCVSVIQKVKCYTCLCLTTKLVSECMSSCSHVCSRIDIQYLIGVCLFLKELLSFISIHFNQRCLVELGLGS